MPPDPATTLPHPTARGFHHLTGPYWQSPEGVTMRWTGEDILPTSETERRLITGIILPRATQYCHCPGCPLCEPSTPFIPDEHAQAIP